jgi:hypothetical protein
MQAESFHAKVISDYEEIVGKVRTLGRELSEADAECRSLSDRIQGDTQVLQLCSGLAKVKSTYQNEVQTMQNAFAESERIWAEEHRKQGGVARAADQAVR